MGDGLISRNGLRNPDDVIRMRKSYGAVRCGFQIWLILRRGSVLWYILRCRPVPCWQIGNQARCGSVRFSAIVSATVRFRGFMYPTMWFGAAVWQKNPTVRLGAVVQPAVRFGAIPRWNAFAAVQFQSPQRKPYKSGFSLRCTVLISRTKSRFRTVLKLFLGALTKSLFIYGAPHE